MARWLWAPLLATLLGCEASAHPDPHHPYGPGDGVDHEGLRAFYTNMDESEHRRLRGLVGIPGMGGGQMPGLRYGIQAGIRAGRDAAQVAYQAGSAFERRQSRCGSGGDRRLQQGGMLRNAVHQVANHEINQYEEMPCDNKHDDGWQMMSGEEGQADPGEEMTYEQAAALAELLHINAGSQAKQKSLDVNFNDVRAMPLAQLRRVVDAIWDFETKCGEGAIHFVRFADPHLTELAHTPSWALSHAYSDILSMSSCPEPGQVPSRPQPALQAPRVGVTGGQQGQKQEEEVAAGEADLAARPRGDVPPYKPGQFYAGPEEGRWVRW